MSTIVLSSERRAADERRREVCRKDAQYDGLCGSCRHRWIVGCPGDEVRGDGRATLGHRDHFGKRDYTTAGARVR
jgi:hypothetical protein